LAVQFHSEELRVEDFVVEGYNGVRCVEAGGPPAGTGCGGYVIESKSFAVTISARSACWSGEAKPPQTTSPRTSNRFNDAVGLKRLAHFQDLDVVRRSRLKKATLFEIAVILRLGVDRRDDPVHREDRIEVVRRDDQRPVGVDTTACAASRREARRPAPAAAATSSGRR
jgi:hypothetical protein